MEDEGRNRMKTSALGKTPKIPIPTRALNLPENDSTHALLETISKFVRRYDNCLPQDLFDSLKSAEHLENKEVSILT